VGDPSANQQLSDLQESFRALLRELSGNEDISGLDIFRLVRMAARAYGILAGASLQRTGLTRARWQLLLRLMAEERRGNIAGMSPTELSRCQHVSKNTVSALLRGLEESGLIERTVDPRDRRAFRIRLTEAGRNLVQQSAATHLREVNRLADGLSPEERARLVELLEKLHHRLAAHLDATCREPVAMQPMTMEADECKPNLQ